MMSKIHVVNKRVSSIFINSSNSSHFFSQRYNHTKTEVFFTDEKKKQPLNLTENEHRTSKTNPH